MTLDLASLPWAMRIADLNADAWLLVSIDELQPGGRGRQAGEITWKRVWTYRWPDTEAKAWQRLMGIGSASSNGSQTQPHGPSQVLTLQQRCEGERWLCAAKMPRAATQTRLQGGGRLPRWERDARKWEAAGGASMAVVAL